MRHSHGRIVPLYVASADVLWVGIAARYFHIKAKNWGKVAERTGRPHPPRIRRVFASHALRKPQRVGNSSRDKPCAWRRHFMAGAMRGVGQQLSEQRRGEGSYSAY